MSHIASAGIKYIVNPMQMYNFHQVKITIICFNRQNNVQLQINRITRLLNKNLSAVATIIVCCPLKFEKDIQISGDDEL